MIIALYARGLSTRGIQAELKALYDADVSPTLISNVTHSVLEEVQAWQARPLDPVYPIIYFDCLFVKSRQEGSVRNKAVYLALGINMDGEKELLGMWLGETEGAKFWLSVFNELKTRGVEASGLRPYPAGALRAAQTGEINSGCFPQSRVLSGNKSRFCPRKTRLL